MNLHDARPGFAAGLRPDPVVAVSEWADQKRVLNQRSASEPGQWRTSRTPYLRDIMDDLSAHSGVEIVTLMKGAQVGGTEAGNNWIGYLIDQAPGPCMVVQPTVDMGKRWSKQRLSPMIEDIDCLSARVRDSRSRDSGNTTLSKEFDGGILIVAGANSASGLRSMPVKNLMLDEVDAYPHDVDGEGDPIELAINRTKTFPRRKILLVSTPTTKGASRIERSFKEGDQRFYHVPCTECNEYQKLEFKNLHWLKSDNGEHLPDTVAYTCVHCGALIDERHKPWMLEHGRWVPEGNENGVHHSYHLSSLYSPLGWESWASIVRKFLASKNDSSLLKTFTNTIEGLPYEEHGDKVDRHALEARAEDYPLRRVPMGGLVLTCGVDVQDNRLEVVTWAHGQRSRWAVDYQVFYGSPAENDVWVQIDDYLSTPWPHAAGTELIIQAAAVDSGGHFSQRVYDFCRLRKSRHVIAVKGASTKGKPIIGRPTRVDVDVRGQTMKKGAEVWLVGTDTAKSQIYGWLKIDDPDHDGYLHFSKDLPSSFYDQLVSERLVTRYHKGFPILEWVKPAGRRNEVLDCTVYAIAAFWHLGLHRWRPAQWRQLEDRVQPATGDLFAQVDDTATDAVEVEKAQTRSSPRSRTVRSPRHRRGGGFVTGVLNG